MAKTNGQLITCGDAFNRLLNAFLRTPEEVVKQQINDPNCLERSAQEEE